MDFCAFDKTAIKYVYQPIANQMAKRFGIVNFSLAQQCAGLMVACHIGIIWFGTVAFGFDIWMFIWSIVGSIYILSLNLEAQALWKAFIRRKPVVCSFSIQPINRMVCLFLALWGVILMFTVGTSLILEHEICVSVYFFSFISGQWFLMCDPVMPKPKTEEIQNKAVVGADS